MPSGSQVECGLLGLSEKEKKALAGSTDALTPVVSSAAMVLGVVIPSQDLPVEAGLVHSSLVFLSYLNPRTHIRANMFPSYSLSSIFISFVTNKGKTVWGLLYFAYITVFLRLAK